MAAGITEPEMEYQPTPFESLPLCFNSFHIAKEESIGHKHSPFNPNYRRSKNKLIGQHMVEQPVDRVCILDDIPSMNNLPGYDQYDDDYVLQTQANTTEKSVSSLWDKDSHFQQLKYSDQ